MNKVVIIDYGVGNLLSVTRAFEAIGGTPELSSAPEAVRRADRLVLPGDGAFGYGMGELRSRGLDEAVLEFTRNERPFLGICLGMQLMLDGSEEFGEHSGLGLIPGRVVRMPAVDADGRSRRIPHIGWNALLPGCAGWDGTPLNGLTPGESAVYFVHSFMAQPKEPTHQLAECDYDGLTVSAVIRRDALTGCQFHPEKSGPAGLRILANFMAR